MHVPAASSGEPMRPSGTRDTMTSPKASRVARITESLEMRQCTFVEDSRRESKYALLLWNGPGEMLLNVMPFPP